MKMTSPQQEFEEIIEANNKNQGNYIEQAMALAKIKPNGWGV